MAYKNHKNLEVWQLSMELAGYIHQLTLYFPKFETFALASQMQRASYSIPSNIAEGHGRDSDKEFNNFLRIAIGSACELQTQTQLAF